MSFFKLSAMSGQCRVVGIGELIKKRSTGLLYRQKAYPRESILSKSSIYFESEYSHFSHKLKAGIKSQ